MFVRVPTVQSTDAAFDLTSKYIFPKEYIYLFRIIAKTNSCYFPEKNKCCEYKFTLKYLLQGTVLSGVRVDLYDVRHVTDTVITIGVLGS
jgi:hypothetical protein